MDRWRYLFFLILWNSINNEQKEKKNKHHLENQRAMIWLCVSSIWSILIICISWYFFSFSSLAIDIFVCKYILVINPMWFEMRFSLCLCAFVCLFLSWFPLYYLECALVRDENATGSAGTTFIWPYASVAGAHIRAF